VSINEEYGYSYSDELDLPFEEPLEKDLLDLKEDQLLEENPDEPSDVQDDAIDDKADESLDGESKEVKNIIVQTEWFYCVDKNDDFKALDKDNEPFLKNWFYDDGVYHMRNRKE
jgi:hypothetical protein